MNRSISKPVWVVALSSLLLLAGAVINCSEAQRGPNELISTDLVVGDGAEAVMGKRVSVHYTGWLYDASQERSRGVKFDSSRDRDRPFTFTPGRGVIKGWSKGIPGMKVGGVRELVIPPELAYGDRDAPGGKIPPNSTLVFEIELLSTRG